MRIDGGSPRQSAGPVHPEKDPAAAKMTELASRQIKVTGSDVNRKVKAGKVSPEMKAAAGKVNRAASSMSLGAKPLSPEIDAELQLFEEKMKNNIGKWKDSESLSPEKARALSEGVDELIGQLKQGVRYENISPKQYDFVIGLLVKTVDDKWLLQAALGKLTHDLDKVLPKLEQEAPEKPTAAFRETTDKLLNNASLNRSYSEGKTDDKQWLVSMNRELIEDLESKVVAGKKLDLSDFEELRGLYDNAPLLGDETRTNLLMELEFQKEILTGRQDFLSDIRKINP